MARYHRFFAAVPELALNTTVSPVSPSRVAHLFFCHGAREPGWRAPFDAIVARFGRARPQEPVALGFLELMEPDFETALAGLITPDVTLVRVVPLFLAPGRHTRRDLPALIEAARQRWPAVRFEAMPTLLENPAVLEAILASSLPADAAEPTR